MLTTLAQARDERARACFLRPRVLANEAILHLQASDVPTIQPTGLSRAWVDARMRIAEWRQRSRARAAAAASSFWIEWYRELRRQIADERLPIDLRGRLRQAAHRSFERAQRDGGSAPRFTRTAIRARVGTALPPELAETAAAAAIEAGIPVGRPYVLIDVHGRDDAMAPALAWLSARGYSLVRFGASPLVDVFVLLTCRLAICDGSATQRTAYITNTPTLTINATDAYTFYPVRDDGVYLLKDAIDLDSGRELMPSEWLAEAFYRNQRNLGLRENSAAQISAAVAEMVDGLEGGWRESDGQRRYRELAVATGAEVESRVRHVAKWGPLDGFIGDGRLARVQADRAS
jgi:hypothetical protein